MELLGCGTFGKVYKAQAYSSGVLNLRPKSDQAKKQRRKLYKSQAKLEQSVSTIVAVKTTKGIYNACFKPLTPIGIFSIDE